MAPTPKQASDAPAGQALAIVPAYNESESIERVIDDLRAHAPDCDVVVVDDHSTDDTAERARRAGAVLLRLPYNLGIGGAVQTGFRYARRRGYRYAFQFDGDGQHPADEVYKLLAPLRDGAADVVIGSRFLEGKGFQSTAARRVGIRLFQCLSRITSSRRVADTTSGFRAYNERAIAFLVDHYPSDYPEVEAITLLARNGIRIAEVPVQMRDRQGGSSSIGTARSLYYMTKVSLASLVSMGKRRG
jgi:glycosyltransferase involved in cell wall biosynthesis